MTLTELVESTLIRHGWTAEEIKQYDYRLLQHYREVQIEPLRRVQDKARWQQLMAAGLAAAREALTDTLAVTDADGATATYSRLWLRDPKGVGLVAIEEAFYPDTSGERLSDALTVAD